MTDKRMIPVFPGLVSLLFLFLVHGSIHLAIAASAEILTVRNVSVIAMEDDQVQPGIDVTIVESRIARMERTGKFPIRGKVIDGTGKYLLPGLIDMHVHVRKESEFGLYLASGITTVRNMNGSFGDPIRWREAIGDGTLLGPRFITAGPFLWDGNPEYKYHVENPEKGREFVREFAKQGFDLIKVYQVKTPTLLAILDEAEKQGIGVCGHYPDPEGDLETILNAGMGSIEHMDELVVPGFGGHSDRTRIPDFVRKVRSSGVTIGTILSQWEAYNRALEQKDAFLTKTLIATAVQYFGSKGEENARKMVEDIKKMDAAQMAKNKSDFAFLFELLKALNDEGVNIVASTDSHQILAPAGVSLHNELALFLRAGLTRYDILRTTTVNAARALGQLNQFGTITVGKIADLVLVNGNPLGDLTVLRSPEGIVLRGQWLDRRTLDQIRTSSLASPDNSK